MESTTVIPKTLILSGHKASIGYTIASEARDTTQEKNMRGKNHSSLLNEARSGETNDTDDGNDEEQQNKRNRKEGREGKNAEAKKLRWFY